MMVSTGQARPRRRADQGERAVEEPFDGARPRQKARLFKPDPATYCRAPQGLASVAPYTRPAETKARDHGLTCRMDQPIALFSTSAARLITEHRACTPGPPRV